MKTIALTYITTAFLMLGLDSIWLTLTAETLYRARLGGLLLPTFAAVPALVFYLIYTLGLVIFAGLPSLAAGSWRYAATRGGLMGGIAYATYDLTNQATLRGWSTVITLVDMGWGVTLSAAAATGSYFMVKAALAR